MENPRIRGGRERSNEVWEAMMQLDSEDMQLSYIKSVSSLSGDEPQIILSMKKPSKYDKELVNRKSMQNKFWINEHYLQNYN